MKPNISRIDVCLSGIFSYISAHSVDSNWVGLKIGTNLLLLDRYFLNAENTLSDNETPFLNSAVVQLHLTVYAIITELTVLHGHLKSLEVLC